MAAHGDRVVIAGGTGLIGRALIDELSDARFSIVVLTRDPAGKNLGGGARLEPWDAREPGAWSRTLEGACAVVNLAGEDLARGRWTPTKKQRILESRVASAEALVNAFPLVNRPPPVLLQASAVGYYGDRGEQLLGEDAGPGQGFLARVSRAAEQISARVQQLGARRIALRTGMVLSGEGGALRRLTLPFRLFLGGPLGSGEQWVPWIHIRDVARAIRFLLEREEAHGPFNITAPMPVRNRGMAAAIGGALGRRATVRTPAWALKLLFGEKASVLLSSQHAVPTRLQNLGFHFLFDDVRDAVRDLMHQELPRALRREARPSQ